MSMVRLASLAALLTMTLPATAMAQDAADTPIALAEADGSRLTDAELADVYGQGTPRGAFWRSSAQDQVTSYEQQNAALLPVTFANWFNDVASPLIWSNVLAAR